MAKESALKPFYSVLVLAFACSILVAGTAVGLRPLQQKNKQLDQKRNILQAAGIFQSDKSVDEQFEVIESHLINLTTGEFAPEEEISIANYNQLKAAASSELGQSLAGKGDIAGLGRLETYAPVYLVKEQGQVQQVILPVRGKGLWSTMFAYVALDSDLNTINGISFYAHGETPGLGGEVENKKWQAGWQGKQIYDSDENVKFQVVKGVVEKGGASESFEVDGLTGATMTTKGVSNLMEFWFGEHGFKLFLERMKKQGGFNG